MITARGCRAGPAAGAAILLLSLSACDGGDAEGNRALFNGAAVDRTDDAPGNAGTAPVPRSGSNAIPPNANGNMGDDR
ncbi:hypothetical protein [Sphingobium chlorophenolicum]|uniref:Lipoprotein n=1 Tax=Sphingobium chlorophenolicum TaxID=46429 RepID=A0A081RE34_SPHCR|nr:hypothetical protein [Sphingobium chlorophenolicum]KEQ53457.1 putative uncharacterized protein precursor [Sphingobium chlorophenolicum]